MTKMVEFRKLNSDEALVVKTEHITDAGPSTQWFVCIHDGHLLNCGNGLSGRTRAQWVAERLNRDPDLERKVADHIRRVDEAWEGCGETSDGSDEIKRLRKAVAEASDMMGSDSCEWDDIDAWHKRHADLIEAAEAEKGASDE